MTTPETPDSNLAAYLIFKGVFFTYRVADELGRKRIFFGFPKITSEKFHEIEQEYLNSEMQDYVDAQRKVKNVVRNLAT